MGSSHTPVTRRERQKNSERQRTSSTSTLAASVGLPCPFSPSGAQDGGSTEWHASERLSQANLDAITFPGIPGDGGNTTGYNETLVARRQTVHGLSDASMIEDTAKDIYRERAFSLEVRGGHSAENTKLVSSPTNRKDSGSFVPSPPASSQPSIHQHLSSLRISESSVISSIDQERPLETCVLQDFDEVFYQNPAPLSPPTPFQETSIIEEFPPPPPPLELEQEAGQPIVGRFAAQDVHI